MQELVVESVMRKTPKSGGNAFFVVKGQDGEEMTTFDATAEGWGRGTKLNVEVTVKGSYVNIAKYEVVEQAAVAPIPDVAPQERGLWQKELGECLRVGFFDDTLTREQIKALRTIYISSMFSALGINLKQAQED